MTRLLRTIRLDPSDTVVFPRAAAPGEWAVPGGFCFWDDDPATLQGQRRQAFRAGFLGLGSFGWSTLVEVAQASDAQREDALAALAAHIRDAHGAPDEAAARAAAEEEIAFAESLCAHPVGTLVALARSAEDGAVRERFRTLHERAHEHRAFETLPVFAAVSVEGEEEPAQRPDLAQMARAAEDRSAAPRTGAPDSVRQAVADDRRGRAQGAADADRMRRRRDGP